MATHEEKDYVILGAQDIQDYNKAGMLPESTDQVARLQAWLEPTDYMTAGNEYKKHLASYILGTGEWLWNSSAYCHWADDATNGVLWIKGVPGAGKSVWAAATADRVAKAGVPVLFFFFRQIVGSNDNPRSLVKDWLCQLLSYSPYLQYWLKKKVDANQTIASQSTEELWEGLCAALDTIPKAYCIADALDEIDIKYESFIPNFVALGQKNPQAIKVIITSRTIPRLDTIIKTPTVVQLRLDQDRIEQDIVLFVKSRLKVLDAQLSDELKQVVEDAVCSTAQGLFLHARLVLDDIKEKIDHGDSSTESLSKAAQVLPNGLKALYSNLLIENAKRSGVPQPLQLFILEWVTHSIRPLRLLELAEILQFSCKSGRSLKEDKELVRASCGRLLEVLPDETVSIIHHSFTEYLRDTERAGSDYSHTVEDSFPIIQPSIAHQSIALACLKYLMSGCLNDFIGETQYMHPHNSYFISNLRELKLKFPFLDYAIQHWDKHAGKSGSNDPDLLNALNKFVQMDRPEFVAWDRSFWHTSSSPYVSLTALHVAARFGLPQFAAYLVEQGSKIDELNRDDDSTPLLYAVRTGNTNTVKLLLEHGAKTEVFDSDGYAPLHHAAKLNLSEIIQALLAASASPTTTVLRPSKASVGCFGASYGDTRSETALQLACEAGHVEAIGLLSPLAEPSELAKMLYWVCTSNNLDAVKGLLSSKNIDVNAIINQSCALSVAVSKCNPEMIKALVDRGADPNLHIPKADGNSYKRMESQSGQQKPSFTTPMHSLARCYYEDLHQSLDVLVKAGGDINSRDSDGWTLLHHACRFPSRINVLLNALLNAGADASGTTNTGLTPMHVISYAKQDIIDILVQHGANVNARCHSLQTPLQTIKDDADSKTYAALINHGADVNNVDVDGNSPLHCVLRYDNPCSRTVELFINAGADVSLRNKAGDTPLLMMKTFYLRAGFLDLLAAAGADMNAQDMNGNTVLFKLIGIHGAHDTAEKLISLGASAAIFNNNGENVLHKLAATGSIQKKMFDFFLNGGADPLAVDNDGETVLHHAARGRADAYSQHNKECLEFVISKGVHVKARNQKGQTALLIAAGMEAVSKPAERRWDPLQFLLEHEDEKEPQMDVADDDGVMPLHCAAAVSQLNVNILVAAGADISTLTRDGLSVLHIAARNRQPDIIGFLLSKLKCRDNIALLNLKDASGRTALHYASASGRPESVRILVDAGAEVNATDKRKQTPLHEVANFLVENAAWKASRERSKSRKVLDAGGILLSDPHRAYKARPWGDPHHHDSAQCLDSINILLSNGSDVSAQDDKNRTPLDFAIDTGCIEMVAELLHHDGLLQEQSDKARAALIDMYSPLDLAEEFAKDPSRSHELFHKILHIRSSVLYDEFLRIVNPVDILTPYKDEAADKTMLHDLAFWRYASVLEKFANHLKSVDRIPDWEQVEEPINTDWAKSSLLHLAVSSKMYNLDIVKILVETLEVPVNMAGKYTYEAARGEQKWTTGGCAIHELVRGERWSNIVTLEYLLQHGADPDAEGKHGHLALAMILPNRYDNKGLWKNDAVELLIRSGADLNRIDQQGRTYMFHGDVDMMRKLRKYGADFNVGPIPVLYSEIESDDLEAVAFLLEEGCDPNALLRIFSCYAWNRPGTEPQQTACLYPLEVARTGEMMQLLLNSGASMFTKHDDGRPILHCMIEAGRDIRPLLDTLGLDLEITCPQGRTLFLAVCHMCAQRFDHGWNEMFAEQGQALIDRGANITATDQLGRNAVHYLCSGKGSLLDEEQYSKAQELIVTVIAKGKSLNEQPDHEGRVPLHYLFPEIDFFRMEIFFYAEIDMYRPDKEGNTLVHYLISEVPRLPEGSWILDRFLELYNGRPEIINARNKQGESPIFFFLRNPKYTKNLFESYKFLVEKTKPDLHIINNNGESLLHVIAQQEYNMNYDEGALAIFKELIAQGLDPLIEDRGQKTALDVVAIAKATKILEMFSRKGKN